MKKILLIGAFFLICAISAFSQRKTGSSALLTAIKEHNYSQIDQALKDGYSPDAGLSYSIELGDLDNVKYFVKNGANKSLSISHAVEKNNYEIVKYLLEQGAEFLNDTIQDIDGQVYLRNKNDPNDLIPITIVRDEGQNKWLIGDEFLTHLEMQAKKNKGYYVKYKTQQIEVGNSALINAIANNNFQMVELLFKRESLIKTRALVRRFNDFRSTPFTASMQQVLKNGGTVQLNGVLAFMSKDGYICSSETPSPAVIMRPVEYAFASNANRQILDALLKYDSIKDYKFTIEKVRYTGNNQNIGDISITPFEFGFTLNFNAAVENIFGASILYSIDNVNFKQLKKISYLSDNGNSIKIRKDSITFYFCSKFNINNKPDSLCIQINASDYLIDKRDGKKYTTTKIGDIEIMAENFKYKASEGCWAYKNDDTNVDELGYLYSWETAKSITPPGWHLPTKAEWEKIYKDLGPDQSLVYYKILPGGSSGLNMKWSGVKDNRMGFMGGKDNFNSVANFWSSTPETNNRAWAFMFWKSNIHLMHTFVASGLAVRYIKD